MSATEQYYAECAYAGVCPVSDETVEYLDGLGLDWLEFDEHTFDSDYSGMTWTETCISVLAVVALVEHGLANDELRAFVEDVMLPYLGDNGVEGWQDRPAKQTFWR